MYFGVSRDELNANIYSPNEDLDKSGFLKRRDIADSLGASVEKNCRVLTAVLFITSSNRMLCSTSYSDPITLWVAWPLLQHEYEYLYSSLQ